MQVGEPDDELVAAESVGFTSLIRSFVSKLSHALQLFRHNRRLLHLFRQQSSWLHWQ
jgi:hypothetical protein